MLTNDIREFCEQHRACRDGRGWAIFNCRDMVEAWQTLKPEWLVWVATRAGVLSECDQRLFACWAARQAFTDATDPRSRNVVDVAERFAHGEATQDELSAARVAVWTAAESTARLAAESAAESEARVVAESAAQVAAWAAAESDARVAAESAAQVAAWAAAESAARLAAESAARWARVVAESAAIEKQAAYIRASYPNPFAAVEGRQNGGGG